MVAILQFLPGVMIFNFAVYIRNPVIQFCSLYSISCYSILQFISADVFGVCCGTFCDFGDRFEVMDADGEDPKEILIEKISKVGRELE
jgi:hypothetical protein